MLCVPRNSVSVQTIQPRQVTNSSALSQGWKCLRLRGETGFATLPISVSQSDVLADVNVSRSRLQCCGVFFLQHRQDKERSVYIPVLLLSSSSPLHVLIMQRQSNITWGISPGSSTQNKEKYLSKWLLRDPVWHWLRCLEELGLNGLSFKWQSCWNWGMNKT